MTDERIEQLRRLAEPYKTARQGGPSTFYLVLTECLDEIEKLKHDGGVNVRV